MKKEIQALCIPVLAWVIVKLGLFVHLGIVTANDSPRYIKYAEHILSGGKIEHDFHSQYIFYSVIIGFFKTIRIGLAGVVLFQLFFSLLALIFLYRISLHLFKKTEIASITIFAYTGWIYAQQWDFYILTDSLFCSFCIWIAYLIICYKGKSKELLIITLIFLLCTLRPNGFVMGIAFTGYLMSQLYQNNRWLFGKVISCLPFLFIILLFYLNSALKSYFPSLIYSNYLEGEIISGYEGILINTIDVEFPDPNGQPVIEMIWFISKNPLFACKMVLAKLFFFFGHFRPYYSKGHNLIIILVFVPCYVFAVKTLKTQIIQQSSKVFLISFIAAQAMVVSLYMDDWDGRFLLPLIPFIFLLASPVINQLLDPESSLTIKKSHNGLF